MADTKYDVVVVGGGPAGSMAGRSAALNGASVLIIEKKSAIGIPNHCNECIAAPHLWEERLGFKLNPSVYSQRITKFTIVAPSGEMAPPLENDCIMVERNIFDRALAEEAVRAGARIMLNTRVVDVVKEGDAVTGVMVQRANLVPAVRLGPVFSSKIRPGRSADAAFLSMKIAGSMCQSAQARR